MGRLNFFYSEEIFNYLTHSGFAPNRSASSGILFSNMILVASISALFWSISRLDLVPFNPKVASFNRTLRIIILSCQLVVSQPQILIPYPAMP